MDIRCPCENISKIFFEPGLDRQPGEYQSLKTIPNAKISKVPEI